MLVEWPLRLPRLEVERPAGGYLRLHNFCFVISCVFSYETPINAAGPVERLKDSLLFSVGPNAESLKLGSQDPSYHTVLRDPLQDVVSPTLTLELLRSKIWLPPR